MFSRNLTDWVQKWVAPLKTSSKPGCHPCTQGCRGFKWRLRYSIRNFPARCCIDLGSIFGSFSEWETQELGMGNQHWDAPDIQLTCWDRLSLTLSLPGTPMWEASHNTHDLGECQQWAYDTVSRGRRIEVEELVIHECILFGFVNVSTLKLFYFFM